MTMNTLPEQTPLSYVQERFWFINTFEKNNLYEGEPVYHNLPLIVAIEGPLSKSSLCQSLNTLIQRHEILRCTLSAQEDQPPQLQIHNTLSIPVEEQTLCMDLSEEERMKTLRQQVNEPFTLESENLHRITLYTLNDHKHYLVWTFHHMVSDRESLKILYKELLQLYQAGLEGTSPQLPELELHYIDYALWQKEMPDEVQEGHLLYWKHRLKPPVQALEIPMDRIREHVHIYQGETVAFTIPPEDYQRLKRLAHTLNVSTKELFYTAYQTLLHRYSGLDEIVTGTLGQNHRSHLCDAVGPVDNLLVIRNIIDSRETFASFAQKTAKALHEALQHQDMPFEQLSTLLNPAKDMSRTAFFDILFHYDEAPDTQTINTTKWQYIETNLGLGKYDHNLLIQKEDGRIAVYLTYNKLYYRRTSIEQFCENLQYLLKAIPDHPDDALSQLPILPGPERQALVSQLNHTKVAFPQTATIHHLFDQKVQEYPDNIALVCKNTTYTYQQLHQYANRFANYLKDEKAVKPGDRVAVILDRSAEMMGVLLGILKAGACYIPVDPNYPEERIRFILEDSKSSIKVNDWLLADFQKKATHISTTAPTVVVDPESLAYVIYTSGTTGKPKGVKVCHRNVVRLFFNEANLFDFTQQDVWTLFHSYCFDFSVWEMYGALLFGGKLVVVPVMVAKDTELFWGLLNEQRVSILNQTPSAFYRLIEIDAGKDQLASLRKIIFGGEALAPVKLKTWYQKYPDALLINMYGITETTVHVTYKEITAYEIENNINSIGHPIPTLGCILLDQRQNLVPRGVAGELYVYGEGVSYGYLNRPELTKERFVDLPQLPGQKLYRSGDLARLLGNGELEYLGRIDKQVKIRGHRIELGELETNLLKHPQVAHTVVTTRKDEWGEAYLVAYYTSSSALSPKELRRHIQEMVPAYMVPSYFVPIKEIPLTSNGKADLQKLPEPTNVAQEESLYLAPQTSIEQQLAEIWSQVLGINRISRNDNFFEIGGHSLKATQVVSRINEQLGKKLKLSDIFAHPVLEELAGNISDLQESQAPQLPVAPKQKEYPLSPAQKRLWVLQQMEENSTTYNISNAYLLYQPIDPEIMYRALSQLIKRHDILRTVFHQKGDEDAIQQVVKPEDLNGYFTYEELSQHQLSETQLAAHMQQAAKRPFDLTTPPLLRIMLIKWKEGAYLLGYVMHHIISDGWSMKVFFTELTLCYQEIATEKKITLDPLPFQYTDYAVWFQEQVKQGQLQKQGLYWQEQFRKAWYRSDLGIQKPRPEVKTYDGAKKDFQLGREVLNLLRQNCQAKNATLFMGLHTTLNALMALYTKIPDTILGIPVAGREGLGLEKQIGFYVNTLAIRTTFSLQDSFNSLLKVTKEQDKNAFENQLYPFDQLVEDLRLKRDVSRSPLFDIMLVLQNTTDIQLETTVKNIPVKPLVYTNESSKFDLTWFFVETEQGLLLRMEYNTDLYEEATIEQLKNHFLLLLQAMLRQPETPIDELAILQPQEEKQLSTYRQKILSQQMETAGLFQSDTSKVQSYVPPQTSEETMLATVWSQLLNVSQPGRNDDFFALGGDSIKAIQLVSQLKKYDYHLTVPLVMRYPSLKEMAAQLSKNHTLTEEKAITGNVPLSPIQHYFFEEIQIDNHYYNQSVVLTNASGFHPENVQQTLQWLSVAHDMLRAVFRFQEGNWQQVVLPQQIIPLEKYQLQDHPFEHYKHFIDQKSSEHQGNLSLEKGPLFQAVLFRLKDQDRLLLIAHHLIIDGVSWRILLEDFMEIYKAIGNSTPLPSPVRTHSYKRWSDTLQAVSQGQLLQDKLSIWQTQASCLKSLPGKKTIVHNLAAETEQIHRKLSAGNIREAQQTVRKIGANLQDLLLAALNCSIQQNVGNTQVGIMIESHGRDSIKHLDLSHTVGWFTTLYPVILPSLDKKELLTYLMETKEAIRKYSRNGSYYGIGKYLTQAALPEEPDMCFNYLGQFQSGTEEVKDIQFSTEARGTERANKQERLFALEFTASLIDQQIVISIKYNPAQYTPASIQALIRHWENSIDQLKEAVNTVGKASLTPSDVSAKGLSLPAMLALQQQYKVEAIYALSPLQLSFFFHQLRYPDTGSYFEQMRYRLRGNISAETFKEALQVLTRKHAVMRSLFRDDLAPQPVQVVLADEQIMYLFEDLRSLSTNAQNQLLEQYATDDRQKGFQLTEEVPLRFQLFRLADEEFEFVLSYHHILMDGWCIPIILNDFQTVYTALRAGVQPQLAPSAPYESYIRWLEDYPQEQGKHYWRQLLQGYHSDTTLGINRTAPELYKASRNLLYEEFILKGADYHLLSNLIQAQKLTLNEVIQALWGIYLAQVNAREDVVFGTVVSGRPPELKGVERMVGLFINTLPVRVRFQQEETLLQLIQTLRKQAIEGLPYHYTQLADLQTLHPKGQLFNHILVFRNYPIGKQTETAPWSLMDLKAYEPNSFDFTIHVLPEPDCLKIRFVYHPDCYAAKDIQHLREIFGQMLIAFLNKTHQTIGEQLDRIENLRKDFRKSGKRNRLNRLKTES
ncbi:amino acid adenylation domain-containing protein [Rapidithrix thailandica]|uniref:Amino acid adenylation domain-containing protein n=1 Tax=Rapidithrix thailandica TaxID=413964 RepID=A0AAW9SFJ2_9BACT